MSCFMHDRAHVAFLVNAALHATYGNHGSLSWVWDINRRAETYERNELRSGDLDQAAAIGQMLMDTNAMSVHARYSEHDDMLGDTTYGQHRLTHQIPTPGAVFQAIASYEYQSCEHDGWPDSEAKAFCNALRGAYCRKVIAADPKAEACWAIVGREGASA